MMITKRKMARGKVRVTFSMAPLTGVQHLNLVGDFNGWSQSRHPHAAGPGSQLDRHPVARRRP